MVAKQLEEIWQLLKESSFSVVEYGAGSGRLCHDILSYLRNNKELYGSLTYFIIEKSPVMVAAGKLLLPEFNDKVRWIGTISETRGIRGCVLSNELPDNFAVHRVMMNNGLKEIFVDYRDDFTEVLVPANPILETYLHRQNILLQPGQQAEICPEAASWISDIGRWLQRGFVLTVDYGYPAAELYHPRRTSGTLLCYHRHSRNTDPYKHIGEQDITTHVNFSALLHNGFEAGLESCGFTTQSCFLSALGMAGYLRQLEQGGCKAQDLAAVRCLADMGQKFKVLAQQKNTGGLSLTGMQFSYRIE
jgi:SAM-dependent MidA family methyltransferase